MIVYYLDKTLTDQLAAIGLKTTDVIYVAVSHTHGDHIGNVRLFPESTVLIQRAEYTWISSPDGPNDNVNQLKALARKLVVLQNILDCSTEIQMYSAMAVLPWFPHRDILRAANH